jgi:serine/threonine protein kinase
MDEVKARELESVLRGRQVGGWTIETLVGHGKSAAVFRASDSSGTAAIKIFDDELIARYGDSTQFARIERELKLVGKTHPNLVEILGGGVDRVTSNHFIVMKFLEGPNLKSCLDNVPTENIGSLIAQLAAAAKFLEDLGYAHRDIKPENIVLLDEFSRLILLDLGVLRPLAGSDLTDADGVQAFVGTLQYSSPEFLLRQEEDTPEGWRALTFYQIGGVLHDLIMRRALFSEFANPYARLVNAVQVVPPEIQNSAVPYHLVELARCCLLKNWQTRLKLVGWSSFELPKPAEDASTSTKQRVTNRGTLAQAQRQEAEKPTDPEEAQARQALTREMIEYLSVSARAIRAENSVFPPLRLLAKKPDENGFAIQFRKSPTFGLNGDLTIFVRAEVIDVPARVVAFAACACLGEFSDADAQNTRAATCSRGPTMAAHFMQHWRTAFMI